MTARGDNLLLEGDSAFPLVDHSSAKRTAGGLALQAPGIDKHKQGNAHELLAEHSRMTATVDALIHVRLEMIVQVEVDDLQTRAQIGGRAQAEKLSLEINAAGQINRGPPGFCPSSRTHLDVLLGRDEAVMQNEYLDFETFNKM